MGCCKEENAEQCGGVCGGKGCTCGPHQEMDTEKESCCGGGCSVGPSDNESCAGEISCCDYEEEYSNALDVGKLVVLSMLTMGAYNVYWMYRNWKHIKEVTNKRIRPVALTVAVLFPILDIILFSRQFAVIHKLTKKEGRRSFPLVWVCIGYGILLLLGWALFALSIQLGLIGDTSLALGGLFVQMIITLLMALVLIPIQLALNDFWAHCLPGSARERPGSVTRTSYSSSEVAWIVVGGLFLLLSFASLFMPPPPFDYPEFGTDNGISLSHPQ